MASRRVETFPDCVYGIALKVRRGTLLTKFPYPGNGNLSTHAAWCNVVLDNRALFSLSGSAKRDLLNLQSAKTGGEDSERFRNNYIGIFRSYRAIFQSRSTHVQHQRIIWSEFIVYRAWKKKLHKRGKKNNYMQKRKYVENATLTETPCKLIKEITTGNDRKFSRNSQSTENTSITVRLSVSRILVRDLRRHLSWEYRSQVEVSAVTFLALNINRTKKSQKPPARFSPRGEGSLYLAKKLFVE